MLLHAQSVFSKYLQNLLRRAAQRRLPASDHDGALDQDRMRDHGRDEVVVALARIGKAQVLVGRFGSAQEIPRRKAELPDKIAERRGVRRCLEVFYNQGREAPLLQQNQGLAGLRAARIVVDGDAHGAGLVVSRDSWLERDRLMRKRLACAADVNRSLSL